MSELLDLLSAQLLSRELDHAARELQRRGEGFYTIGSAGHEANAAVAMALRPTDPALLHYRSGGFYCARAAQVDGVDPVADVLHSLMTSVDDPISGGRHKVFGSRALAIVPQTSTIASHLPRAVGLAFALERARRIGVRTAYPGDAVVVTSLGDASVNHSTAQGALNAAGWLTHQRIPLPLLVAVEDNGLGISVRTPPGWLAATLAGQPGLTYLTADGADPAALLGTASEAADLVRRQRRPVVLHLRTVRLMGHAGSDVEMAYRTAAEIQADEARDPVEATARALLATGALDAAALADLRSRTRERVRGTLEELLPARRLSTAAEVMRPLLEHRPDRVREEAVVAADPERRAAVFAGQLPEHAGPLTLAESLTAALTDLLAVRAETLVLGEDVAVKGGVYGVTRGLLARFDARRVLDTLLDEQTILGTALGAALAGLLPVAEIQYLAYLHNAEDQLRGEGATLSFFSDGQYRNGMIVRIPGLAYQRGFGGHFHNDNSLAVLRDVPGLVLAVPSSAAEAPGLVRALAGLARAEGRVCVLLEPIALYHRRDEDLTAPYAAPADWDGRTPALGECALHRGGASGGTTAGPHTLVVTFGNGVSMTRAALRRPELASLAGRVDVLDLRWIAPLPEADLVRHAAAYPRVVVVDETRRSGGVSEGVVSVLVDAGYPGRISRVTSEDSVIPLGPGAAAVLLSEDRIAAALEEEQPA
ncbi:thiamine pyrophosphate-dependent enzyme [Ornithinimicrobium flavum]|uniref:thiamine pyrophosphate-dependent enzyme n=1 Tax=Ornithinimicrobium flavum TaxID=1288636 RepID=UPI001EE8399B|nr:thiamine pyrophosphate-dependent enzyme [Ornithinimicrobium flavum]